MKKIINKPSDFVEESIDGLIKSHPNIYTFAKDNKRVVTRATKASNKIGIVTDGVAWDNAKKYLFAKSECPF